MKNKLIELYKKCFDDSEEYVQYFFNNKYNRNNTLIAKDGDKIIATLFLIAKRIRLRGVTITCPYIVGACTDPLYRGKGIMSDLIYDSLYKLSNRGNMLVGLYPFRHSFYSKQGFVTVNRMDKETVNYSRNNIIYSLATINDAEEISKFYDKSMSNYDCNLMRNNRDFARKIVEVQSTPGKTILARDNKNFIGYFMYDNFEIIEALGQGIEGIDELDNRQYYIESEHNEEYAMLRIVNPLKLLMKIQYSKHIACQIKLKIEDNFYPNNSTIIALNIDKGRCTIAESSIYDYSLTIEELTLLITGSYIRENYIPPIQFRDIFPPCRTLIFDKY